MVAEDSFPKDNTIEPYVKNGQHSSSIVINWHDDKIIGIQYSDTDKNIMESMENIIGILFETSDKYEVYMNDKSEDDKDNG